DVAAVLAGPGPPEAGHLAGTGAELGHQRLAVAHELGGRRHRGPGDRPASGVGHPAAGGATGHRRDGTEVLAPAGRHHDVVDHEVAEVLAADRDVVGAGWDRVDGEAAVVGRDRDARREAGRDREQPGGGAIGEEDPAGHPTLGLEDRTAAEPPGPGPGGPAGPAPPTHADPPAPAAG